MGDRSDHGDTNFGCASEEDRVRFLESIRAQIESCQDPFSHEQLCRQLRRYALFLKARPMAGREQDVDDVLQDVAVRVLEAEQSGREIVHFRAWMGRVVQHCVADSYRDLYRRRTFQRLDTDNRCAVDESFEEFETDEVLATLMERAKLSASQRETVRLYFHGSKPHEVADGCGRSAGSVRTELVRIRKKLQECGGELLRSMLRSA